MATRKSKSGPAVATKRKPSPAQVQANQQAVRYSAAVAELQIMRERLLAGECPATIADGNYTRVKKYLSAGLQAALVAS